MKNYAIPAIALLAMFSLSACQQAADVAQAITSNSLQVMQKEIYLRGEMNDYAVMSSYRLVQDSENDNLYCTVAPLRSDWAPYRFKFADSVWSDGSNFGFVSPPGILREGSSPVLLNPHSRFEEISFYPSADGNYRFCMLKKDDKFYALVERTDEELASLHELLFSPENILNVSYVQKI